MSEARIPQFWSHLDRQMSLEAKGLSTSWVAPVAKVVAKTGFDESCWIGEIPDSVIAIRLGGAHVTKALGLGAGATTANGGNFTLQPKGTPNCFTASQACAFGHILLRDELLDRAADALGQAKVSGRLRPDLVFHDHAALNKTSRSYVDRALNTQDPPSSLEMEGRAMLLLDALLDLHGLTRPKPQARGGLSGWQLRRVTDFMIERAADDLALDELAALVDLSAKHFARAFRQSTGVPPHRWLIERRIDRAKELLAASDHSLAEIALACGFADQSHFTAVFRKAVGATPGGYRREIRV